jgi:hypothetical protein
MPLLNILASGAYLTTFVLEITDCSDYMSASGKKDSPYSASLFEPHIQRLDPMKKIVDLSSTKMERPMSRRLGVSSVPNTHHLPLVCTQPNMLFLFSSRIFRNREG